MVAALLLPSIELFSLVWSLKFQCCSTLHFYSSASPIYGPASSITMKEGTKQKRTTTMDVRGSGVFYTEPRPWQMYPLYFPVFWFTQTADPMLQVTQLAQGTSKQALF